MTAVANVRQGDLLARNVEIQMGYLGSGMDILLQFEHPEQTTVTHGSPIRSEHKPLRLNEDLARALYEALGRHFGDSPADSKTTRQDLLHERGRVDKMIDNLLGRSA